jgi:dimethylaniline monooxygenase (N-oxide forming)
MHFDLVRHVRFNTRVLECLPLDGGRWKVRTQESGKEVEEAEFEAVVAATGHLSSPFTPDFKGQDAFTGQFIHSHTYRTPAFSEGKRVAIIGIGSSAVDIAAEMCPQTTELYVVTRRGAWIIPRFVLGTPAETWDSEWTPLGRRFDAIADRDTDRATLTWLSESTNQKILELTLNAIQGKHPEELRPKHGLLEQSP